MLAALHPHYWLSPPKALRIDVEHNASRLEEELDALYARMRRPGDLLYQLPSIDIVHSVLTFRYRVADGEHYIYVEDRTRQRLAGYTVFNRLVELDRRADRELRAPHSRYAPDYQRRGIARAIYKWWLDGGRSLITGARQSPAAHALWNSLGSHYCLFYVELRDKTLTYLGPEVCQQRRDGLHTRMVLLPPGADADLLGRLIGLKGTAGSLSASGSSRRPQDPGGKAR